MKITAINVYKVNIPFKMTVGISQRIAKSADNIVVVIHRDRPDLKGYGEGAPRPYVTGETQNGAINGVRSLCLSEGFPWDLTDINQICNFVDGISRGKEANAALCALEMALLDLLGKEEARNIVEYLPSDYANNEIRYGAGVPIGKHEQLLQILHFIKKYGFENVRLKMGRDFHQNQNALHLCRQIIGPQVDLLVDVNMAWDLDLAIKHLPLLKSYGVKILEQPLPPNDPGWEAFATAAKEMKLALMADELVCSPMDLEDAIQHQHFDIINMRLSKCGGFHLSLKMIERIREAGLTYMIGCHLGESGILSAAGRALSSVSSDALYHNGSYDDFLLEGNLTSKHLTFDDGGRASPLTGPGLGVTVNHSNLAEYGGHIITVKPPRPANKVHSLNKEVANDYGLRQAT